MNNTPKDILHQLMLFKDGNDRLDSVRNISEYVSKIAIAQAGLKKSENNESRETQLDELYKGVRKNIFKPLMVRRTRTDLIANECYKKDLARQKIAFPEINQPVSFFYTMDDKLNSLFNKTLEALSDEISGFRYSRYKYTKYLSRESLARSNLSPNLLLEIYRFIKISLVKRLDSNFYAFEKSLANSISAHESLLSLMNSHGIVTISKDIKKVEKAMNEENFDVAKFFDGDDIIKFEKSDFENNWQTFKSDIEHDLGVLKELKNEWADWNIRDPKIEELKDKLGEIFDKDKNRSQKIIIFTENKDSADYLYKNLNNHFSMGTPPLKCLQLDSMNFKRSKDKISENFDATHPGGNSDEYNVLITTNILSEGVNLHHANTIINYDTPWNSTILMQRIGRVNRIGATSDKIFIYNFMPTEEVNHEISNKEIAKTKLSAFHKALGEDSQIYTSDEDVKSFKFFEILTGKDDVDDNIKYLEEIKKLKKENPRFYHRVKKKIPLKARSVVMCDGNKNSTISFIRIVDNEGDERDSIFLKCVNSEEPQEIASADAFKSLRANIDKEIARSKTPEFHYRHVRAAVIKHEDLLNSVNNESVETPKNTNAERKAIDILLSLANDSPMNISRLFETAAMAIERKKYIELHSELIRTCQEHEGLSNEIVCEHLAELLREKYNFLNNFSRPAGLNGAKNKIIISQSCV